MTISSHQNTLSHFCHDETDSLQFAGWLASLLKAGDIVFLKGDLGTGKTTMARGIIRTLCGHNTAVPSPTFTLVQKYQASGLDILHADLYRLNEPEEVYELDLFSHHESLVLLEWGEMLEDSAMRSIFVDKINIDFKEQDGGRLVMLSGSAHFMARLASYQTFYERSQAAKVFIEKAGFGKARRNIVAGDASGRRYERLQTTNGADVIFMDWPQDGAFNKYARQVKLGEQTQSFVAIAGYLNGIGLGAPEIYERDLAQGFMLLEDFGSVSLTDLIDTQSASLPVVYGEAIEVLAQLHATCPEQKLNIEGVSHQLSLMDRQVMAYEVELFCEWYVPHCGKSLKSAARVQWQLIWQKLFARLEAAALPRVLVLRDFHSPNIIWRDDAQAAARIGLIDVQDALIGSPIYDLVSLLQDARRNVPLKQLERSYQQYLASTGFDTHSVNCHYHILSAQRNLRICGVFARLAMRDGRTEYLKHLPRVLAYIELALEHPDLHELKNWLQEYL